MSACSNLPIRVVAAPVKAPFSWPKSSLSRSSAGSAAQLTLTKGLSRRGDARVDCPRDQLLADAAFSADEHGDVTVGHLFDHLWRSSASPGCRPRTETRDPDRRSAAV